MPIKTAGPCDLLTEHLQMNAASYSTTPNTDADDYRWNANISGVPLRTGHTIDSTAYTTAQTADSWYAQLKCQHNQV